MESLDRSPTRRYAVATAAITFMALTLVSDGLYFRPGPITLQQKAFGILLSLLAVYVHTSMRADHVHYRKMNELGCAQPPKDKNNLLGIPKLMELSKVLKTDGFLQFRSRQLARIHTFESRLFPETVSTIVSDDPENVKTVLSTKFEDWDLPGVRTNGFLPLLGAHSIFTTNGAEWRHSRSTLRPAFLRDQISDLECFDRHIFKLIEHIPKDGSRFDIQELFSMLTIDSISDFMFGQSTDILGSAPASAIKFGDSFDAALVKIANRSRLGFISQIFPDKGLDEYVQFVHKYVDNFVAAKKRSDETSIKEKDDRKYVFLDELIKSGEPEEVVRSHLLGIFLAGRDTTTSALTYLFFELSRNPEIVATLRKEIAELGVRDPSWEQLKNMKYLNWTIKEALRLNPPVPTNARGAARDTILPRGGGSDGRSPIFVRKGTVFRYQPWVMQRRKDIYGEDAEEFRPERWEALKVVFEYVPFNAGPRICIGQQFALTQMAMITFRLMQAFTAIKREDDRPPVLRLALNTAMKHGCWVSMTPA